MDHDNAVQTLLDKQTITELIYRYCRAVDRIDPELGYTVFHADASVDYGDFYQGDGRGLIDRICAQHRSALCHSHQTSNITINVNGDKAGSETYVTMNLRSGGTGSGQGDQIRQISMWGRYLDEWSRRDGRWGIDRRIVVADFDEMRPASPMGTLNGVGRRDRTDPSYRILGDN
jgi:hypothetical protein